jgi:hypothetical protein
VKSFGAESDYNFVYSNSALEHMAGDYAVLDGICSWARRERKRVTQLHVLPATAALPLYRTHGYRVYSRLDIARLLPLFKPARASVVGLGGWRSWILHSRRIGQRTKRREQYARELLAACRHDVAHAGRTFPIMWAIVVFPQVEDSASREIGSARGR